VQFLRRNRCERPHARRRQSAECCPRGPLRPVSFAVRLTARRALAPLYSRAGPCKSRYPGPRSGAVRIEPAPRGRVWLPGRARRPLLRENSALAPYPSARTEPRLLHAPAESCFAKPSRSKL
jgi:hypothetical protein